MKSLEIVPFENSQNITELAQEIHASHEPGFQIDNVDSINKLLEIFEALLAAAPRLEARIPYREATLQLGRMASFNQASRMSTPPHTDIGITGLAVHHNITDEIPVTLATSILDNYESSGYTIDPDAVINLRTGMTIPGRLTIFSEGGFPWLKKTVHFFDRRATHHANKWARYTQGGSRDITKKLLRVFNEIEISKIPRPH